MTVKTREKPKTHARQRTALCATREKMCTMD
jgi:hypothetical protein